MIKYALKAVSDLNQEVYDYFESYGLTLSLFELRTNGISIIINFMGQYRLWFSDEDEREYCEETDEYEPIEQYLRRESQKIITQIGKIKLFK
jgi:hypothetical protein